MKIYNCSGFNSNNFQVNNIRFAGYKEINLRYVLEKRKHLLPQTMISKISEVLRNFEENYPTLRELHINTYAPLLNCKSLDEARNLYPEFRNVLDASIFENSRSKNIAEIKKHVSLNKLSLKLLQETWANLKNQDDIARELGLSDRLKLGWIIDKIGFVNRNKNYTTLLKASDPQLNAEIARKTTAYNNSHPEQMFVRNRFAAQACKKAEYRQKQSLRIIEYDKVHPERKQKISNFFSKVWEKIPDVKETLKNFSQNYANQYEKVVIRKYINGEKLTANEKRLRKIFYKHFWQKFPECKAKYAQACREVSKELKASTKIQTEI